MKIRFRSKKKRKLTSQEARWRRERAIIIISVIAIGLIIWLGTYLTQKDLDIGVGENILLIALVDINLILLVLVIFLVLRNLVKLIFERRKLAQMVRLRTKLVLSFAGLTLFPTLVMFLAAIFFFSASMDKFFNVQVENSLEGSLEIAQTYYSTATGEVADAAREVGGLTTLPLEEAALKRLVDSSRERFGLGLVKVFSPDMRELASSVGNDIPEGALEHLNIVLFDDALAGKAVATIQNSGYGDVVWALFPIANDSGEVVGVVMTARFVPKSLLAKMTDISRFLEEYKTNKLLKKPIVISYLITLSGIALLVVFTATWLGFYLAKGITVPLSLLAEGTRKVAEGDMDVFVDVNAKDEVGILVDSFNKMTQDLKSQSQRLEKAYNELSRSNIELDRRRAHMEIILKNVAAGVISIDRDGMITTINKSAERILAIKMARIINRPVGEVLSQDQYRALREFLDDLRDSPDRSLQRQLDIPLEDRNVTILATGNHLLDEDEKFMGVVTVFDDMTEINRAQKMYAWREVARRIAHEIKNPLTPIQLSAQRIRKKYFDMLGDDREVLEECTDTIITQVEEMKSLVDEFSHFARMPSARPRPNDLNEIVREALNLYKDAYKDITYNYQANQGLPIMQLDREQIKRALINLLDNAVEALSGTGSIDIKTEYMKDLNVARLVIADTGPGISREGKNRLFEPYYSTKKTGTGLGLTIVNTIISDHRGYIRVIDNTPHGTKFIIDLPVSIQ
ncbi:MAG: HAMP domain-containing protein [Deltaproteobacteria bacterium]|nr:HAMP domain-containing protein [Candidatus Zymogenaceae bacterium]